MSTTGTVYLIHFERPIGDIQNPRGRAQHYMGWARNLEERISRHSSGNGAALMAAVSRAGIAWNVVRTWPGGRELERRLKNWHKHRVFCPVCSIGD